MKYTYNKQLVQQKSKLAIGAMMALVAVMTSMTMMGGTHAEELATGAPAPKPVVVCSDVKSLTYKGDARVGELGFGQILVNYSVSPCDTTTPVRVEVSLTQNIADATPVYLDENAALSGKFTVNGVLVNTSYIAKVTVYNAATNEIISSSQIFAAARTKPV